MGQHIPPLWESVCHGGSKRGARKRHRTPRQLNLAASALPTPSCLDSRGFHIFINPPSPAGDSKGQPNTPQDSRLIQVQDQVGKTGHPEHNQLPQTVPTQSNFVWIPAEAGFTEAYTTKCWDYLTIKFCWEGRAFKQFFLSLVIDHWIGEVIKWTDKVDQATPRVWCPQHRVGPCPVTFKRFRKDTFSQRWGKQLK